MRLVLAATLALTAATATAIAQPRPRPGPTFTTTVEHRTCSKSWMFMCNMPAGNGLTYGTAREVEHCQVSSFAPDGTASIAGAPATYRIVGATVWITQRNDDGTKRIWSVPLGADGHSIAPPPARRP